MKLKYEDSRNALNTYTHDLLRLNFSYEIQ